MKKLADIPAASDECCEFPDDEGSRKIALARRLEADGHQTIACGRSILTIERCESPEEAPPELKGAWGTLKISVYSDPDVSAMETPMCLYPNGSRYGMLDAFLQIVRSDGRERISKFEEILVRDET